VWELLRPLINGQQLFVIPDTVIYDPVLLPQFLYDHKITRMLFTPSLLDSMLGGYTDGKTGSSLMTSHGVPTSKFASMKLIVLCGEVVTVALRNKCRDLIPTAAIHNLYSISECHDVSGSDLTQDSSLDLSRTFCPVGTCLPGVGIHILDEQLHEVPAGVHGEVYISGPTLARGYLRRPELTAERFVSMPSALNSPPAGAHVEFTGEAFAGDNSTSYAGVRKMYRTGDVGYLVGGGRLEICGRCDSMVKVRGYSIELRAVQMAIIEHCSRIVTDCLVIAEGDAADSDKIVVAYLVCSRNGVEAAGGQNVVRKEIRAILKKRLPFYMIPTYFAFLDSIPVHPTSGKLDKKRLPTVASIAAAAENDSADDAPKTPTECSLAELFLSVLSLPQTTKLDVTASFFDLGGHSLLTVPLLQGIEKATGRKMSLSDLFQYPSVRTIAEIVDGGDATSATLGQTFVDLPAEVLVHNRGKDILMQIRAFWRHIEREHLYKICRVLLTGAAGFLGAFLVHRILKNSNSYILLLIRPPTGNNDKNLTPAEQCRARVWDNLMHYGLATSDVDSVDKHRIKISEFDARINVLVGDTSLGGLGLESDDYAYLTQHIDVVIHAAAQVNLLYPYSALAGANVVGTAEIIDFCMMGKVKSLHYISSNAVLPVDAAASEVFEEDTDLLPMSTRIQGGYAQTKWVAEQLVYKAMSGGLPAVVYRCGNLAGDSQSGAWNGKDSNLQFMRACVLAGAVPVFSLDNETPLSFEMTSVDFVASFVVACVDNIRIASSKTFHLIQPQSSRCATRDFLRVAQEAGHEIFAVPLSEWITHQHPDARQFSAEEIVELFGDKVRVGHRLIEEQIRQLHKIGSLKADSYPLGDMSRMRSYFSLLTDKWALLPACPRVQCSTPLEDRVVIVTGASSGIGESIARHLLGMYISHDRC
jgi:thioester reductase-like protein